MAKLNKEPVPLQHAAKQSKLTEEELLEQSALRRVPLAAWAHNWNIYDGKISETTGKLERAAQHRVLRNRWLYLDWGYARMFITGSEDQVLRLGMYRSTPRGPVNVWAENPDGKPALRRADLYVHMSDVERARRHIEKRSAGHLRARTSQTADPRADLDQRAMRGNPVRDYVEQAITAAGSTKPIAVHTQLRKIALAKKGPFTGEVSEDGGFLFFDSNNKLAKYTKDALSSYLGRRNRKQSAPSRTVAERR